MEKSLPQPDSRTENRKEHAPEQNADPTRIPTVTQITPDDILAEEGPIVPAADDDTVSQEQVEQQVVTVNPSVDSMESRG